MKSYIMYVCEKCGKESRDSEEIKACEASHYGLTVDEMLEWLVIQDSVRRKSSALSNSKNERTEEALNREIEKLVKFEKEHNLLDKI